MVIFHIFCHNVFKVVCCRFAACGKGLKTLGVQKKCLIEQFFLITHNKGFGGKKIMISQYKISSLSLSNIQQICCRWLWKHTCINNMEYLFNPFPHIVTFWCLCIRRFFENMATKEEIAQNEQFLLLQPCFQLYSIIVLSFTGIFCAFV